LKRLDALLDSIRGRLVPFAMAMASAHCGGSVFREAAEDASVSMDVETVDQASSGGDVALSDDTGDDATTAFDGGPDAGGDAPADAYGDRHDSAAPRDASAEATVEASACSALCNGCCDSTGHCQAGTTTAVCGAAGSACVDCSSHVCVVSELGCCKAGGGCGCAVAGIVGCN
jgi:hypothetical protein